MEIFRDIEQGTEAWHQLRLGIVTASRFKDVLAKGQGKTRKSYMLQLAAEIITGEPTESYTNEYMEWGTQTEPQARAMYEFRTDYDVEQVAFIKSGKVGISPDGLVGKYGGLEIKCPKSTTQIEIYLSGKVPTIHKAQIQGSMWVAEREWWDFVSFDPRIDGASSFFLKRVERDQEYIDNLEKACKIFTDELMKMVEILRST